jgi:hypothetical protein
VTNAFSSKKTFALQGEKCSKACMAVSQGKGIGIYSLMEQEKVKGILQI